MGPNAGFLRPLPSELARQPADPIGGCLALFKHPDPSMKGGRGTAQASIAFEVEDLDACMADLRAKDVAFTSGIIKAPNCRMANIKDSEGNAIILHQLNRK